MKKLVISAAAISSVLALIAAPGMAQARHHHYRHATTYRYDSHRRYASSDCNRSHHHAANTGTVLGAVGGGLIGNAIGGDAAGTIVGAGAGAVVGHQIGAHSHRCG